MKASFSPRMFPGETATIRAENKRMFAEDVKSRCQNIYTNVHTLHSSDITTITSKMPRIIQTTIACYAGSCKNCRRHAVVCRGVLQNNWRHKSQHLKASGVAWLNMTDADRLTLRQGLIEMRLGNAALQMTRHRITTDKNESINRPLSASLPKNVNFSRNAQGRVCSVIDRINYGAGISVSYNKGWRGCSGSEAHSALRGLPTSIFQTALRAAAQTTYKAKQNERLF